MAVPIPDSHMRLLAEPIIAHLATIMPDGRPQVNPVWCDYDGTNVRVNAADDRQKSRNMVKRHFATVFLADGPYFWMEIRGRVIDVTPDGAMDHMHVMPKNIRDAIATRLCAKARRASCTRLIPSAS